MKRVITVAGVLKVYSAMILVISVGYHLLSNPDIMRGKVFDDWIAENFPIIARNHSIIGFHRYEVGNTKASMWGNFAINLSFLLIGLLI